MTSRPKYIIFESKHVAKPLDIPQTNPPISIITNDFPSYVKNLPCVYFPDDTSIVHGHANCTAILQQMSRAPEPLAIASVNVAGEGVGVETQPSSTPKRKRRVQPAKTANTASTAE